MRQQFARFVDDRSIAIERGVRFAGRLGCGIVLRCYVSDRSPLRFAVHLVDSLIPGIRQGEKTIRAFLDWGFCRSEGDERKNEREQEQEKEARNSWAMHKR